jgi:arylsulfatase
VIIAQGGVTGGWSLYAVGGKPKHCHNLYGLNRYYVEGEAEIPPNEHQVRLEFDYYGGGRRSLHRSRGAIARLYGNSIERRR